MNIKERVQVFSEGDINSKIVIVGEALGEQEVKYKKVFCGMAGDLLNQLLCSADINRSECYITNVIKERPPNNNISTFIKLNLKSPQPSEAYNAYVELLKEELMESKANIIIALGNVPLFALTGMKNILKRRGSIYNSSLLPGKKVIASIHPSYTLRFGNYLSRYYILFDLIRAKFQSEFPFISEKRKQFFLNPSYFDAIEFLKQLANRTKTITFDIEVLRNELSHIGIGDDQSTMCIPLIASGRDNYTAEEESAIMLELNKTLNCVATIIGQNLNFDMSFILRKYSMTVNPKNLDDTMIASGILTPEFPKGLDFLTSVYTNEPYYKDEGKQHIKMGTDDESFRHYNAMDAYVCNTIFPKLKTDLIKQGNFTTYQHQRDTLGPFGYMQERGIRVNMEGIRSKSKEVEKEIAILREELGQVVGTELNPNSPKQLQTYFYVEKGIKPYTNRKTGKPAVDKSALKRLARRGFKEAQIILGIRKLSKLKSTYLDVTFRPDGRLVCSFNPVGSKFSRASSSKNIFGEGLNFQNLDYALKEYMLADEGYLIFDIDLSQAENRIVAYIAPDYRMIEAFENNQDVHALTGSFITGKTIDEIKYEHDNDIFSSLGNSDKSWRFWAKKANHGFNYGWGPYSFAYELEIPNKDGLFLRNKYLGIYPGVKQYWNWVQNDLRKTRSLTNLLGRRFEFKGAFNEILFKMAYSYAPQSTVGDLINQRGLNYIYYNQDKFKPVELLNQVHDSIMLQIPTNIGWKQMSNILLDIKINLEIPLNFRDRSFTIPAGFKVGKDLKNMITLKDLTEIELQNAYVKLNQETK